MSSRNIFTRLNTYFRFAFADSLTIWLSIRDVSRTLRMILVDFDRETDETTDERPQDVSKRKVGR